MDGNTTRQLDSGELRQIERASDEIDRFIERRSAQREEANEQAEEWRASERRYAHQRREGYRIEWMTFYLRIAEAHERSAELAREKAWSLDA